MRFVRVQVSVDYSYSICGVSPLRLDFYIELPQGISTMTNGGGVAYTLITYAGPADLRTLDTAQACSTILDATYQSAPGQLVQPAFGTTSATLNYDCFMVEIESKILQIIQERIFKSIFLAVAPIILTNLRLHLSMSIKSSLIRTEINLVAQCRNITLRYWQLCSRLSRNAPSQ